MATAPDPPIVKSQPLAGVTSLTFSWQPPLNDGGSPITSYNIAVYGDPSYSGLVVSDGADPNDRQKTIGLPWISNGVTYYCRMIAINAIGGSAPADFRPFQAGNKPTPPASASATKAGQQSVLVSWTSGTTPDATIFWYVITAYNQTTSSIVRRITANGLTQISYFITNLPYGTYEFRVQSVNCPGYSAPTITNTVTLASSLELFLQGSSWTVPSGSVWPATTGPNAGLEDGIAQNNGNANALYLNGSTAWTVPNLGSFPNFTVNVWWKDTGTINNGIPCIITEIFTGGSINFAILTNDGGVSYPNFGCGFFNAGWYLGTQFTLPANTWINIQYTYDGTNIVTYINGAVVGTVSTGGVVAQGGGNQVRLGRRWDASDYVTGFLGEVRIYSSVLSPAEVLADYNQSLPNFP
jgi:hypothetical protein